MGLRSGCCHLEGKSGGTGLDDSAGVYWQVSWLLVDLLYVHCGHGVVDHYFGKAAGISSMPDLGGCVLSGEQFDADLIKSVRPAGSVEKKTQPKVKPDLARGAQRIVPAICRGCGYQLERVERDAPEIVAKGLRHLNRWSTRPLDEHLVEIGSHAARAFPVDHERQRASKGAVFDLEEIGRIDSGIRITAGKVRGIGRHEADAEKNRPSRRIHGSGQVNFADDRRTSNKKL